MGRSAENDFAEAEQVGEAGLDLEAAGEPGADEQARVVGDGDQVVAFHAEPDLGGLVGAVGHGDRGRAIGTKMGAERDAQVVPAGSVMKLLYSPYAWTVLPALCAAFQMKPSRW